MKTTQLRLMLAVSLCFLATSLIGSQLGHARQKAGRAPASDPKLEHLRSPYWARALSGSKVLPAHKIGDANRSPAIFNKIKRTPLRLGLESSTLPESYAGSFSRLASHGGGF